MHCSAVRCGDFASDFTENRGLLLAPPSSERKLLNQPAPVILCKCSNMQLAALLDIQGTRKESCLIVPDGHSLLSFACLVPLPAVLLSSWYLFYSRIPE